MNIQQYIESDRQIYAEFASCVGSILESAITNAGQFDGIQKIQHRAKEVDSLSRKLKDRDNYHSETIELDIKDLAGCRLIFYHNDDLNTFLHSSLVSENFDVDWDESKIHHPDFDAQSANDFYMGNHFVVTLKSDRTDLPEFAKFAGLLCEIQAQTLLNHAWSETIHDITYKKRGSKGFGDRAMVKIDERLMSIMKDYLRPAGYEFQKVKHDFAQLEAGRDIFDKNINQTIGQIQDANELHDLLQRYKDYVLPNYSDYPSFSDEIYSVVEASLERARQLGVSPVETPLGPFDGKDYKEILSASLDILSFVRYVDFDRTLALLGEICKTHVEPAEQDIICECALYVAGYNDDVLQRHGYVVQEKLVNALSGKSDEELLEISGYVLASCEAILTPNIEKTEWTHDQVTFGKINLPGSAELAEIRSKALRLLQRLAKNGGHATRQSAFSCMEQATRTPNMGNYDDELLRTILNDTNSVINSYIEDIDRLDFEMMQANEERISFHYRRSKQILAMEDKPDEVKDAAEATVDLVRKVRDKASGTPNYERYKVLVGFRSIFEDEWDDDRWDWREKETYRNKQIDSFVDSISDENINEWVDFFAICVKADSSDLATFQYFSKFLQAFAREKPELVKQALEQERSGLEKFLVSILLGLADAGRIDLVEVITDSYIAKGERLWECIRLFALLPLTCRAVLHKAKDRAVELEDCPALYEVMLAVIMNHDSNGDELDSLFLPAIEKLTGLSDAGWINEAWFKTESIQFLKGLNRKTAKKVLDNLISLKELDHHAEWLIEPIAENYPDLVLELFGVRLDVENKKERGDRYDAIPYDFQKLGAPLSAQPELVVDSVFSWFKKSSELFQYRGANVVSNTFPEFDEKLEDKLIQLVQTANDAEIDFVTSILRNYKGETFLHTVCRAIVIAVNGEGPFSREVEFILEESGVLHGEFGFVERCKRKKEEIAYWLNDPEPVVREFAEKYTRSLERQRAAEQRRAEEDLELRKHKYD